MDSSAQAGAFGVGAAAAAINMGPDGPLAGSQEEGQDDELVSSPGHIPMAQRLSLESWGSGSMPPMPDVDDDSGIVGLPGARKTLVSALTRSGKDVFGSESGSSRYSTTSVESSIYHYIEENGRTYHRFKEGKYPLPNDQQEQDRLDLQHALFVITTHGKLFLAPIGDDVRNILDIATGTGIWAIEIAQQFPNAHVIGTDLSPIQPQYVPANCHFEIDDAEDEWTFSTKFDYIHGRALLSCFKDPSAVIRQACDALGPGGYFEFQDGVFPMQFAGDGAPANCALRRWNELVLEGAARTGRPWTNTQHYKRCFEEVGLENVVERRFYWPVSPWAKGKYYKTVATFFREDMLSGLDAASLKTLGALGWSVDAIRDFLLEVRKDFHDPSINAYLQIAFVYGRKPGAVV